MADGILFDKVCRGYNKEQVNAFILKLNTTYQQQLAEQAERIQAQNEEIQSEKMISDTLREAKEALEEELCGIREEAELLKTEADEMAASLRELHGAYTTLKESYDALLAEKSNKDGAIEVGNVCQNTRLSAAAQDRFDLVCEARNKILSKLTAEKIIISKEELTKLVDRLSADAAEFYRTFTGGKLQ